MMSTEFSEESLYVARNWETVAEIIEAAQRLRSEMGRMLTSLEDDLRATEWWPEGWEVVASDATQLCISREAWRSGEKHFVWICVDRFRPENAFGLDGSPYLYAYVRGHRYQLRDDLIATLDESEALGDIGTGGSSLVIVQQPLATCLPDAVPAYLAEVCEQMLTFFDRYARLASVWDPIVRRHFGQ